MGQVKPIKILPDGRLSEVNSNTDEIRLKSFSGEKFIASGSTGEKFVILADSSDNNQSLFTVKDASGFSVTSIDEKGKITSETVSACDVISNSSYSQDNIVYNNQIIEGNSFISGNMSVSGDISLGSDNSDTIIVNAVFSDNLDLGSNKIVNLATPLIDTDAANKEYVDNAIAGAGEGNLWSISGNNVPPEITDNAVLGTTSDVNVSLIRNNVTYLSLFNDGGDDFLIILDKMLTYSFENSMFLETNSVLSGNSLGLNLVTGLVASVSGDSGDLLLKSGDVNHTNGESGDIILQTGSSVSGNRGQVILESDNISASGNLRVSNNLDVLENTKISGVLEIGSDVSSSGSITSLNDGNFGGNLSVSNNSTIGGNLSASGDIYLGSNNSNTINIQGKIKNDLDLDSNKIFNLQDPTENQDAATKYYVDQSLSNLGTESWSVSGNVVTTEGFIGTLSNHDVTLIRNNSSYISFLKNNTGLYDQSIDFVNGSLSFYNNENSFNIYTTDQSDLNSKDLLINTGNSVNESSGNIELYTGEALSGNTGDIYIHTGISENGNSGSIILESNNISVSGDVKLGFDNSSNIDFAGKSISELDLNYNKILNLATPTASGDAANKQYVDQQDSSTLTSANTYTDNKVSDLSDASMLLDGSQAMNADMSLGENKITSLATPTASGDATNKDYVDQQDSSTLSSANTYTDSQVSDLSDASMLLDGSQAMNADMDLDSNKILNLATPTASGDASNKFYVDQQDSSTLTSANAYTDSKVSDLSDASMLLDGSQAMTGDMDLDSNKILNLATPTASGDAANKFYVDQQDSNVLSGANTYTDSQVSDLSDASMLLDGSQAMNADMNLGGNKITSLATPTAPEDATNKAYVDTKVGSIVFVEDLKIPMTASGAIAEGSPVYLVLTADETIAEADATNSDTSRVIGFAENSISDGLTGYVTLAGFATIPTLQIEGSSLDIGKPVYLSENPGKVTSVPPELSGSRVMQLGMAVSPNKIIIDLKQGMLRS